MSEEAKYKVGLIGAGRAGVPRARAFDMHPLCEVVAIADTDHANLELAAGRFGVPGYDTWDEMLEHHELDIGMAVLPVRPNADAVVALAQAGVKTIFCEKPLTGSLTDADRMVEETSSRGIPLVCGVVVSSTPDYQKAYQLVADGEIGEIVRINLYENNNQMGTHGLNLARRFAGRPNGGLAIGWVSGDPLAEAEDEHEDGTPGYGALGGYFRFDNEVEVFSNYRLPNHHWRGIEIMGTHGAIFNWNNTGPGLHLVRAESSERPLVWEEFTDVQGLFLPRDSIRERDYDEDGWRYPGNVMLGIVDEMVENLETGAPIGATTGDDMRQALEIAVALRESARNGHAPTRFPVEDRSISMLPQKTRWFYKKTIMGDEAYMAQLADQKKG